MNSLDSSTKLYNPKPIKVTPASAPYNSRLITIPIPRRISFIPNRNEGYDINNLESDDRLAMMAEVERELLGRRIVLPIRSEINKVCRSSSGFPGLERPSNAMIHDDIFGEEIRKD